MGFVEAVFLAGAGAGLVAVAVLGLPGLMLPRLRWWKPGRTVDVIIVLGCKVRADGEPGYTLRSRVERGVELYHQGVAPRILFTGAAVYSPFVEAEVMARLAEQLGVPREAMVLETRATNTRENATYSIALLRTAGWREAVVTTSAFHCRRSAVLFAQEGLEVLCAAARTPSEVPLRRRILFRIWERYLLLKLALGIRQRSAVA